MKEMAACGVRLITLLRKKMKRAKRVRSRCPQPEEVSEWERQQQQFNEELDRKLIICRGC
jgi:hypothetical protein